MSATSPGGALQVAVQDFIADAVKTTRSSGEMSDRQMAKAIVKGQAARRLNSVASITAQELGYLGDHDRDQWGRQIDERALLDLGLVALLREKVSLPAEFAEQLAGYLSGPQIDILDAAILDLEIDIATPCQVAGWTLDKKGGSDLDRMRPLPCVAQFARTRHWEPAPYYVPCATLTRINPTARPRRPSLFGASALRDLWETEIHIPAWRPLLLLNLFAATKPVSIASEYEVEPGRHIDRGRGPGVTMQPSGPDGDREWPTFRAYFTQAESNRLKSFLLASSTWLEEWGKFHPIPRSGRRLMWLQRNAHRFLLTNRHLDLGGGVLYPRMRAEVVTTYVSILENLVAPENGAEISRRVHQRVALIAGSNDAHRLLVAKSVKDAYGVRSAVAHGAAIRREELLSSLPLMLRRIVRRTFRNLLILGPEFDVAKSCDDALLSKARRRAEITGPVRMAVKRLAEAT